MAKRKGYNYDEAVPDHRDVPEQMEQDNKEAESSKSWGAYMFIAVILALVAAYLFTMHSCDKPTQKPEPSVPVTAPIQHSDTSVSLATVYLRDCNGRQYGFDNQEAAAAFKCPSPIQERQGEIKPKKDEEMCKGCGVHFTVNGVVTDYEKFWK